MLVVAGEHIPGEDCYPVQCLDQLAGAAVGISARAFYMLGGRNPGKVGRPSSNLWSQIHSNACVPDTTINTNTVGDAGDAHYI